LNLLTYIVTIRGKEDLNL